MNDFIAYNCEISIQLLLQPQPQVYLPKALDTLVMSSMKVLYYLLHVTFIIISLCPKQLRIV